MLFVPKPAIFRAAALVLLALCAGMALAAWEDWRRSTVLLDSPVTSEVRGRVVSREVAARGSLRYVLDLGATSGPTVKRAPQRITLVVRARHTPFEPGAWMAVRARLSPPSGPACGAQRFRLRLLHARHRRDRLCLWRSRLDRAC